MSLPVLVSHPVADHAVLVELDADISDASLHRVQALDRALTSRPVPGLTETVPALTTLLVRFDPLITDHEAICATVRTAAAGLDASVMGDRSGTVHILDVCYDGDAAPDLLSAASRCGIDPATLTGIHASAELTVGMFGFAPGFAYLYGLPAAIQLPRNPTPGPVIPAGSVIIAGQQCIVTPTPMSTGWFAIGRTAANVLMGDERRPLLFDVGDSVRFRRISRSELDRQFAAAGPPTESAAER